MSGNMTFLIGVVIISMLCFGTTFVPLRSIQVTNYAFFQWVMCNAILLTAIPWALANRNNSLLEPIAMMGGVAWCLGNYLTPFIIERLGLGIGSLLWSTVGMTSAWASSMFGIFGIRRQYVHLPLLNCLGVVLIVSGGCLLSQVKVKINKIQEKQSAVTVPTADDQTVDESGPLRREEVQASSPSTKNESNNRNTPTNIIAVTSTREGIAMCLVAGFLHGVAFNPAQFVVDHSEDLYLRTSNLILSHFAGIAYTSVLLYFLATFHYSYTNPPPNNTRRAFISFRPVEQTIILPGALCGILWGVATIAAFTTIESLPLSITYPLISAGPNVISTIWSVFYFKEITEFKDLCILAGGVALLIAGLTCICLSG